MRDLTQPTITAANADREPTEVVVERHPLAAVLDGEGRRGPTTRSATSEFARPRPEHRQEDDALSRGLARSKWPMRGKIPARARSWRILILTSVSAALGREGEWKVSGRFPAVRGWDGSRRARAGFSITPTH